jgi:hypothetical protein
VAPMVAASHLICSAFRIREDEEDRNISVCARIIWRRYGIYAITNDNVGYSLQ